MNKKDFTKKMNNGIEICKKQIEVIHLLRVAADKWDGKVINKRFTDYMSKQSGTYEIAPNWRGETTAPRVLFSYKCEWCDFKRIEFTILDVPHIPGESYNSFAVYNHKDVPYIGSDGRLDAKAFKAALNKSELALLDNWKTRERSIKEYDKYKKVFDKLNELIDAKLKEMPFYLREDAYYQNRVTLSA